MSPPRRSSFSGCRTIAVTVWPRLSASFRIAEPTKPVAPNKAIFIWYSSQIDAGGTNAPLTRYLRGLGVHRDNINGLGHAGRVARFQGALPMHTKRWLARPQDDKV